MTPTDAQITAYHESLRTLIDEHGWALQGVFAVDEGDHDWCYTIGLHEHGHPELVVTGTLAVVIMDGYGLLSDVAARVKAGERLEPGRDYGDILVDAAAPLTVRFREVPSSAMDGAWFNALKGLYGRRDIPVLQMLYPDDNNTLPDEEGYDASLVQPLID